MFNISYEEIISKIKEEKNLSDDEINEKIRDKLKQLSDLISREGAAHIVANELGIQVVNLAKEVKIDKLANGMNNVVLVGKVLRLNDVVSYHKNGRGGKVASFLIGDESGTVRVVFWDDKYIHEIESGVVKEGTVLKLKNGYVRNNNGYKEVHLGNRGEVEINPEGIEVEASDIPPSFEFSKKKITELSPGDVNVGVFGTIVQIFEPRFYEACPNCGKKVETIGEGRQCKEHGVVKEELIPVVNISFDDGSDNLRAVAFRNQAEQLLGKSRDELLEIRDEPSKFDKVRNDLLGKQVILIGRVTRNEMFARKEMSINRIVEVKPEELLEEMERGI